MITKLEVLSGGNTSLDFLGNPKASISTVITSTTTLILEETGESLTAITVGASIDSAKSASTIVESEASKTVLEAVLFGGTTSLEPAISGLNGFTQFRDLTDVNFGTVQDDYYVKYDANTDKLVFSASTSGGSSYYTQKFILSQTDITNKYVRLDFFPDDNEKVQVVIFSGIEQEYLVDYYIIGKDLKWDGLSFEYLLEVGSRMVVRYNKL